MAMKMEYDNDKLGRMDEIGWRIGALPLSSRSRLERPLILGRKYSQVRRFKERNKITGERVVRSRRGGAVKGHGRAREYGVGESRSETRH